MIRHIDCILLIDDDKVTNFYNKKILNKHSQYKNIITKTNGDDALEYIKEATKGLQVKPDLIFLDINMPAMNGWEFIIEFEKLDVNYTKDMKLVMLTTSNIPEDYERYKANETIDGFINKPLSVSILSDIIESNLWPKI